MSSFGERIYDLRNRNNMSQGALADKLDVSRQTVSKWENNMCLPEAEKLLQLSEIFGVSLDYIMKGETEAHSAPEPVCVYVKEPKSENIPKYNERIIKKYVGLVLAIVFGVVSAVVFFMQGTILTIIPFTGVLIGVFLYRDVKNPWLKVSWITYILTVVLLPFFSGFSLFEVFGSYIYEKGHEDELIITYAMWGIFAILILCTIKATRGYIFRPKDNS